MCTADLCFSTRRTRPHSLRLMNARVKMELRLQAPTYERTVSIFLLKSLYCIPTIPRMPFSHSSLNNVVKHGTARPCGILFQLFPRYEPEIDDSRYRVFDFVRKINRNPRCLVTKNGLKCVQSSCFQTLNQGQTYCHCRAYWRQNHTKKKIIRKTFRRGSSFNPFLPVPKRDLERLLNLILSRFYHTLLNLLILFPLP